MRFPPHGRFWGTDTCTAGSNVLTGVAGITADANSLINYARNAAQRYLLAYDEDMPVEQLAQRLCDLKQGYTQYGGALACHAEE